MGEFLSWLSAGAGNILLAILAGAGGSALLELLWRPRRDRRRVASILTAEIALNTELLLLQAHSRSDAPLAIPSDLRMSMIAWQAAGGIISELPAPKVRQLVHLYNQYDSLNRHITAYGDALDRYRKAPSGSSEYRDSETMVLRICDVFNSGLDETLNNGQSILLPLAKIAGIRETTEEKAHIPHYADIAAENMAARKAHVEALRAFNERQKEHNAKTDRPSDPPQPPST